MLFFVGNVFIDESILVKRLDIQGLRAISSLLVALFHIYQWGVSGGVDVFLTVSGYFLWATAVRLTENRSLYFQHYTRFFSRTAPQALIVATVTLLAALVLLNPYEWVELLRDAAFSAVFLQNYWLAISGDDYLARDAGLSLYQHYWAISVIAQVYFLFPLLVLISLVISRLLGRSRSKMLPRTILVATLASFIWCLVFSSLNPEFAYFDTFARFWQFGAGALVAGYLAARQKPAGSPSSLANTLSWCGLIAILCCGALWGRSFPGLASLWPTAAAVLVLVCSKDTARLSNAGTILSQKNLSNFGEISFGLYLWHWPIYAIYFRYSQEQTVFATLCIIGAAVLLAIATKRAIGWFEANSSKAVVPLSAVSIMLVLGGTSVILERGIAARHPVLAAMDHPISKLPLSLTYARRDVPITYETRCNQTPRQHTVKTCDFGDLNSSRTIYLVGGSHSAQWLPPLRSIATEAGYKLVSMTKSSCRFFDTTAPGMQTYMTSSCRKWNDSAISELERDKPDIVVTLVNTTRDAAPAGILMAIERLAASGIKVVALRDTPDLARDLRPCISQFQSRERPDCEIPREELLDDAAYAQTVTTLPKGVVSVDMNDTLCDPQKCLIIRGNTLLWRDSDHITASYAKTLKDTLWAKVQPAFAP